MMTQNEVAGIDVAKDWLDVAIGDAVERLPNTAAALRRLAVRLERAGITAVGLEPTGGYERLAVEVLREEGLSVLKVDSWRLRQFAKSRGTRTKTDPIDARLIRDFIVREPARPFPEPDAAQTRLVAWVREVTRAEGDIRRLQVRRETCTEPAIRERISAEIATLRDTVAEAERVIAATLAETAELASKAARLAAIPGIGPKTVRVLLAEMPEIGTLDGRAAAALAGLAPYHRHSGKSRPNGHVEGGRAALKRAAYLAASAALLHNSWAKATYDRLRARGKPHKVAVIAIARRLLTSANAMLRNGTSWNPHPGTQAQAAGT